MSLPIRPEVFPQDSKPGFSPQFPKKGENKSFTEFLSSRLDSAGRRDEGPDSPKRPISSRSEKKKPAGDRDDAWSVYGSAPSTPPQPNPLNKAGEADSSNTPAQEGTTKPVASDPLTEENTKSATTDSQLIDSETSGETAKTPASTTPNPTQAAALNAALKLLEPVQNPVETTLSSIPEQKIPPEALETAGDSAENALSEAKSGEKPNGIPVAQGRLMPRTAPKQDEIAPSAKRVNPANSSAVTGNTSGRPTEAASALEAADRVPTADSESKPVKIDFVTPEVFQVTSKFSSQASAVNEVAAARPANLEPVIASIHENVRFLRATGSSHVELIFRPDQNTQLYMQVMKVNGEIHVQVRCEKGEAAQLSAAWGEVQSALANHGVRVEPLQNSAGTHDFSNFSGQSSKQQQEQSESRSARLDQLLPLNTGSNPKPNSPRSSAESRLARPAYAGQWQGWA
jgi:hypothetical protein